MKSLDIINYLKKEGLKASITRVKIYEYLLNHHIHPTMEDIYEGLKDELPTLSKTTIYNVLNLFIDKKLVKLLLIEENTVRYEINLKPHAHFKCTKCGEILDIEIKKKPVIHIPEGFEVTEEHIYYLGSCNKCKDKM